MKVLVIEDNLAISDEITKYFNARDTLFYATPDIQDTKAILSTGSYDVLVLGCKDKNVIPIIREIKEAKIEVPILSLCRMYGANEKGLALLEAGSDDCMAVNTHEGCPNLHELHLRVLSLFRRSKGQSDHTIDIGNLHINLTNRAAFIGKSRIKLTISEMNVLIALALRKGNPLTKDAIMNALYDGMNDPEVKIVDVFICKLRKKLMEANKGINYINTEWGIGYYITANPVVNGKKYQNTKEKK